MYVKIHRQEVCNIRMIVRLLVYSKQHSHARRITVHGRKAKMHLYSDNDLDAVRYYYEIT